MNVLKKVYCRAFQTAFKIAIPFLPYRTPKAVGSVKAIPDILEKKGKSRVLIITDAGIRTLGLTNELERILAQHHIFYAVYDKTAASYRRSHHCRNRKRDNPRRRHHGRCDKAQIRNQRFSADSQICGA